jgi:ParB-like chromosome segregation protein Spo0J
MAVQWSSETMQRTGDLWGEFPSNVVIPVPELNGRREHTDITALVADIDRNGQRTPVLFRKGDNGETILVYGHRRFRAVIEVNKLREARGEKPIKLMGTYMRGGEQEALILAIGENRFRKDVSPLDDAGNVGLLIERYHMSLEEIAKIYFPEAETDAAKAEAVRWVKMRNDLLELAPEAAEAVRDGRIKVTAAHALAKLTRAQQREKLASKPEGRIKGKDIKAVKKPPSLKALVIALLNDLGEGDLANTENEWLSVSRLKLRKIVKALDIDVKAEAGE